MSDDLISRKALLYIFNKNIIFEHVTNAEGKNVIEIIKEQPTVFNVEKYIEQLKDLKTYKLNMADAMSEIMRRGELGNYVCLEDVLQIVKSGGVAVE